jgi:hypothetical protein
LRTHEALVALAIILIVVAYGPFLLGYLPPRRNAPGFGPGFF